jgi:hypothetical protein
MRKQTRTRAQIQILIQIQNILVTQVKPHTKAHTDTHTHARAHTRAHTHMSTHPITPLRQAARTFRKLAFRLQASARASSVLPVPAHTHTRPHARQSTTHVYATVGSGERPRRTGTRGGRTRNRAPGGPYSSTPFGGLMPTRTNSSGCVSGSSITCQTTTRHVSAVRGRPQAALNRTGEKTTRTHNGRMSPPPRARAHLAQLPDLLVQTADGRVGHLRTSKRVKWRP